MSILLKILIGLLLLAVLVAAVVLAAYFVAVVAHERRCRKDLSENYKMYSDGSKKR